MEKSPLMQRSYANQAISRRTTLGGKQYLDLLPARHYRKMLSEEYLLEPDLGMPGKRHSFGTIHKIKKAKGSPSDIGTSSQSQ
ncbi:MAG: hypothetical protein ACXWGW_02845 [Methylobacter sp.]